MKTRVQQYQSLNEARDELIAELLSVDKLMLPAYLDAMSTLSRRYRDAVGASLITLNPNSTLSS